MAEVTEQEVKRALEAEALSYEIPPDLPGRTLAAAQDSSRKGLRAGLRKRAAARALKRGPTPGRWVMAGGLAVLMLSFYAVGNIAQNNDPAPGSLTLKGRQDTGAVEPAKPFAADEGCEAGNCAGSVATDQKGIPEPSGVGGAGGVGGNAGDGGGAGDGGVTSDSVARSPIIGPPGPIPGPIPGPGSGTSIVRTGDMEVRVKKGSLAGAWTKAQAVAGKRGGFIISSNAEQVKGQLSRGTLTVRVPAAALDETVAEFQRLGKAVRLNTSSSDVSGQLVDYDARVRAAQARELQLLELLKQAKSVSDSLQISTALSEVRTEIESLQAQRGSVQNQVDLATLTVSLYEPQAAPEEPRPVKAGLGAAWDRAQDAAVSTISTIFLGAGFLLPVLALLAVVWAGSRLWRRRALR